MGSLVLVSEQVTDKKWLTSEALRPDGYVSFARER